MEGLFCLYASNSFFFTIFEKIKYYLIKFCKMKFVKTIYNHEFGGERVTPFGTIRFNKDGVCAIQDDELAIQVADCSQSLVLAEEDDESVKELLAKLKNEDASKNKPIDTEEIGKFISSADNGAVVKSTKVEEAQKEIGAPAGVTEDGEFKPNAVGVEITSKPADVIGSPVELLDSKGEKIKKAPEKAPITKTKKVETKETKSKETKAKEAKVASDKATREQLNEFKASEIAEMLSEGGIDESKFKDIKEDKDKLIQVCIDSKILD